MPSLYAHPDPRNRSTRLKTLMISEFHAGLDLARDPQNADLPPLAVRVTTIYSPWFTRACPVCRFKFREGDRVRLCPQCEQAYHDDDPSHLHCWRIHFKDGGPCRAAARDHRFSCSGKIDGCDFRWRPDGAAADSLAVPNRPAAERMARMFREGLESVWKPFGKAAVIHVRENHPAVGLDCPWCRFKIRPGDRVVACPCGECGGFFHDDIHRRLACWDNWNGARGRGYCPFSGKKIQRTSADDDGRTA